MTARRRDLLALAALALSLCLCAVALAAPPKVPAHRRPVVACHRARHARHRRPTCRPAPHPARPPAPRASTPGSIAPSASPPPTPAPAAAPLATPPPPPPSPLTPPAAPAPVPLPVRLAVDEYEYGVVAGHSLVAAGGVQLNISNIGQDDHNLTISRDGVQVAQTPVLHPGDPATTISPDLAPGTYKLYCSLYDHDRLGMHATLVVQ